MKDKGSCIRFQSCEPERVAFIAGDVFYVALFSIVLVGVATEVDTLFQKFIGKYLIHAN
jgi:hypothetical protein